MQGWLETCLPKECGLNQTASRVPAGPPSLHLQLWVAEQQQVLNQQLQELLAQQHQSLEEETLAAAAAASGETLDAGFLLQQLETKALAALRSRMPVSASFLRAVSFLSVPLQQRLVAAAPRSLLSLLQRHFGAPDGGPHGSGFSWVRLLCMGVCGCSVSLLLCLLLSPLLLGSTDSAGFLSAAVGSGGPTRGTCWGPHGGPRSADGAPVLESVSFKDTDSSFPSRINCPTVTL